MAGKTSVKEHRDRIEDFVQFSRSGRDIRAEVSLRRETFKQVVHPDESDDIREERDVYLLAADFWFSVTGARPQKVSKLYLLGTINETEIDDRINRRIANERLEMDFQRLRDAGIPFQEIAF